MTAAYVQCRYLQRSGVQCTGEALDPDPKAVQICMKHAGKVIQLVAEHRARHLGRSTPQPTTKEN